MDLLEDLRKNVQQIASDFGVKPWSHLLIVSLLLRKPPGVATESLINITNMSFPS